MFDLGQHSEMIKRIRRTVVGGINKIRQAIGRFALHLAVVVGWAEVYRTTLFKHTRMSIAGDQQNVHLVIEDESIHEVEIPACAGRESRIKGV